MHNVLINYLQNKYGRKNQKGHKHGPVITISREYGCPAVDTARRILSAIQELKSESDVPWRLITKEILDEAAHELQSNPTEVEQAAKAEKLGMVGEVLSVLTEPFYYETIKARRTIGDVIQAYAEAGRVIIIGRGGVVLTEDIPLTLHVKLWAPREWRIQQIIDLHHISRAEVEKKMAEVDKARETLLDFYTGGDKGKIQFDLSLNCRSMTISEISGIILHLARLRGMLP